MKLGFMTCKSDHCVCTLLYTIRKFKVGPWCKQSTVQYPILVQYLNLGSSFFCPKNSTTWQRMQYSQEQYALPSFSFLEFHGICKPLTICTWNPYAVMITSLYLYVIRDKTLEREIEEGISVLSVTKIQCWGSETKRSFLDRRPIDVEDFDYCIHRCRNGIGSS